MLRYLCFLDRLEEVVSSVCIAILTALIGVQVFNRYVLNSSPDWTDELSRYLFIASVFFGCSYSLKRNNHYAITFLRDKTQGNIKKAVNVFVNLSIAFFCFFCLYYGIEMVVLLLKTRQRTPSLEIPIAWVYLVIPIGMGLMFLRALGNVYRYLRRQNTLNNNW